MKSASHWRLVVSLVVGLVVGLLLVLALGVYLHDPPWAGDITSGMRPWEEKPPGSPFRWTTGRASFFVPGDATTMTLPMRAVFPGAAGRPTIVRVMVDDRWLADIELADPDVWVRPSFPLPRRTGRRFRRVDLHVSRVVGYRLYGVETGVITTARN